MKIFVTNACISAILLLIPAQNGLASNFKKFSSLQLNHSFKDSSTLNDYCEISSIEVRRKSKSENFLLCERRKSSSVCRVNLRLKKSPTVLLMRQYYLLILNLSLFQMVFPTLMRQCLSSVHISLSSRRKWEHIIHGTKTIRGGGWYSNTNVYYQEEYSHEHYSKDLQNVLNLIDDVPNLRLLKPQKIKLDYSIILHEELAPLRLKCTSLLKFVLTTRPKYAIVKVLYLLYYASLGAVMPYLPVYFQSLGVPDRRIGHLGAITPAITFLASPMWGYLTDSTGKLKEVLLFTFISSVLFRVMMIIRDSFIWLVTMISITSLVNAPVRTLLDSSVLNLLDDKKEYGRQRLWGQWGFGLGSFIVGQILSKFGLTYRSAFVLHAAISLPTLIVLWQFQPKKSKNEPPKFKEGLQVIIGSSHVIAFFSLVGAIGISSGVIENFAYKRLRELGADHRCLGRSRLLSSAAGVPMFWISGNMTNYISIEGILLLSLLSYIIRFCIYASVRNPWHALPAEALRGACFACFWAASTSHSHKIAPPGLSTTMLGFLQGIYGGIGQSIGSLIGGALSSTIGTGKTFYFYATVDTVIFFLFLVYFAVQSRKKGVPVTTM